MLPSLPLRFLDLASSDSFRPCISEIASDHSLTKIRTPPRCSLVSQVDGTSTMFVKFHQPSLPVLPYSLAALRFNQSKLSTKFLKIWAKRRLRPGTQIPQSGWISLYATDTASSWQAQCSSCPLTPRATTKRCGYTRSFSAQPASQRYSLRAISTCFFSRYSGL